jgi:glycerol-3-phosphate acyltransferase PlsX
VFWVFWPFPSVGWRSIGRISFRRGVMSAVCISVDAMGGDHAPDLILAGVDRFCVANPAVSVLLHGPGELLGPVLARYPAASRASTLVEAPETVAMDVKPAQAMRKRDTSMWSAIAAVKDGRASAAVSAGNTGALMAVAHLQLRTIDNLHRPAIAAQWPTATGRASVVLDVGANVDSDPDQLVDFAIMGEAFARALNGIDHPTVGLLNIGSEDVKGHDEIREAMRLLRLHASTLGLNFHGFVEGNDISAGTTDVVVTDGFTGNVALKTAEGAARLVGGFVRDALKSGPFSMMGALLASRGLSRLKQRMDPRTVNGGVFLGLKGLVVKAHGSSDAVGFASAMSVAARMAASNYMDDITANLERLAQARIAGTVCEAAEA